VRTPTSGRARKYRQRMEEFFKSTYTASSNIESDEEFFGFVWVFGNIVTVSFLLMTSLMIHWTVNLKHSLLNDSKIFCLLPLFCMCTFPFCINKQHRTASTFLFDWLLLSIKLCSEVMTVRGIHCVQLSDCPLHHCLTEVR
jgi:hypothetical protein